MLRRTRELRILLGRRVEIRERLRNDADDLEAQWTLSETLKTVQGKFDEVSAQLAKVDAELERIRAADLDRERRASPQGDRARDRPGPAR